MHYNTYNIYFVIAVTESSSVVEMCNEAIMDKEGWILSPNYPNNYTNNLQCHMNITAGTGQIVQLSFIDFLLELCLTCDCLSIFDGDSVSSPLVAKFCTLGPSDVKSTGQSLYLVFTSNTAGNDKGFNATVQFIQGTSVKPRNI